MNWWFLFWHLLSWHYLLVCIQKIEVQLMLNVFGSFKKYVTLSDGGGGRGYGTVSSNSTRGREGVSQSVAWHFNPNFEPHFFILACFLKGRLVFWKIKMSRKWVGEAAAGPRQCHQMTHGGEGGLSKIGQKNVTYYSNGPLRASLTYFTEHLPPCVSR